MKETLIERLWRKRRRKQSDNEPTKSEGHEDPFEPLCFIGGRGQQWA